MREQSNRVTITTITKKYFCSYLEVRIGGEVALQALVALVLDRRLGLQALKVSNAIAIFEFSSKSAFSAQ